MKSNWKSKCMAVAIAAVTAVGLLSGSSAMVMADPAENVIEPETEQDDGQNAPQEITGEDPQETEPAAETVEGQPEQADGTGEELQEPADDPEEPESEGELQDANEQEETDEGPANSTDVPLDFAADPSSREGNGWKWDQATATLTIDQLFMDLTDYDQDYTAAIVFPDGPAVLGAPVTICITGQNTINVDGLNSDGGRRMSVYSAGDLVITGPGTLFINASSGAAGVKAEGSITIDNAGSEAVLWGLSVQGTHYALYTEKTLTVNASPISLSVYGIDGDDESAMSAAIFVGNADAAETSIDINNSTISLMSYAHNSTDLLVNSGTISIDSTTLKLLAHPTATLVSGIHNRNGDININNSILDIKLEKTEYASCSAICAEQAKTDPAPDPSIRITDSTITSTTDCKGLVALKGGIVCEASNIDIESSDDTALTAGPGGLSLKNCSAGIKSTGGINTYAVDSEGPVTIDNAQVYLEAEGIQSSALYGTEPVTISGAATLVDLTGDYAAFELHSEDPAMDTPLTLNDGLTAYVGGTLQYVDIPLDDPYRIYSFSEGTLELDGYLLKNASTHVSIGNTSGLIITDQPRDAIVSYPAGAEFEVKLYDPSLAASYQWICTNDSGQEFVLDNPTADQPKLVIPCTKQHSSVQYYRCRITDKDGNVLESRRATLDLDNRDVDKTVVYAAWNAIEPGESLDLSEAGLGSGTIIFDPDGTTVTFDNVQYDNTGKIYDDHLIPNIGITVNRRSAGDTEYELILKGDCSIKNTFIQDITDERGISLDFMLYGDEGQRQVVHVREDASGGSLTITGGTIAFRTLADLDLNANVATKTDSLYYMDGIISEGFNLASGYTADLNANGSGISTEGMTSFGDNTNVKIDMMPTSESTSTEKAAIFISDGDFTIGEGAEVSITCHATPDVGVEIDGLAAIRIPDKKTMTATGAEITIGMSAEKGEQYYASAFNGILGGDNSEIILDHTDLSIGIDAKNVLVATGIYSGGDLTMTDSTAFVDVTAVASADGITPEGDLAIVDSTVDVDARCLPYQGQPGRCYAIAAASINADLQNKDCYIKANAVNTDDTGIAFLAKTGGSGSERKGYDPSYMPSRITLAGFSSCILPDMNQISLTSVPGSMHPYIYVETYYDLSDTTKPASKVEIAVKWLNIRTQPQDANVNYPDGAQFTVEAENPDIVESYQWECYDGVKTMVLEGTSATTPTLILPSTRQDTGETCQFRCLIKGKDGSAAYSDYASLTIANKDESKTVLYVGEYAALPGDSIDLAANNIGTGTISFDSDGKTVCLDNAVFDNSTIVSDYMTASAIGVELYGRDVTEPEYVICPIGTNVITNTFYQEDTGEAGVTFGLELYGKDDQTPAVTIRGASSTASLETRGGSFGIYSIGSITIDTNLYTRPFRNRRENSVGLVTENGGVTLAENANVTIRANGYGILAGTSWEEQSEEMNLVMNKGSVLDCTCDIPTPMETSGAGLRPVASYGVYVGNNIRITEAECDIRLTPTLSKVAKAGTSVSVIYGIMAENDISATGSDVTVKLVPKGTSGDIDQFGGIGGNNLYFDHTDVKVTSTPYCFNTGLGIGSAGELFSITNHSDINVNLKADGLIAGFISYGLIQADRSNISLKVDATDDNLKFGIQGYKMDFNPGSAGHRVKIDTGENGYAILAFLESSDKAYNYKKGYKAKQILLSGDVTAITDPIGGEINRYAYPSSEGGYAICETVYDPEDTTKPVSSIVIGAATDLSGATVKPAKSKYTYTGEVIKPDVTVSLDGQILKQGRDYTVKYSKNKNVGKATITVTGKGSFTGAATGTFRIVPKGTTITSVTGGKQKFTVKWKKKTTQTTGYQIQYSTSKTFASGNKKVAVKSAKTTSKTITGLKSKKTYYVRIRTYKTVDGTTYYSGWSTQKSVKTS